MGREGRLPGWLCGLVEESFFVGCGTHQSLKKNEKNILCLDCCTSICPHCAPSHPSHPLLQVRRYVYNDVVRLDDLEKLIDCSFVQPYTINSAKVVFLKPRPQSRPFKGSGNVCLGCDRILQEPFYYCSLACKVEHVVAQGADLSTILVRFHQSHLAFANLDRLQMDPSDDLGAGSNDQFVSTSVLQDCQTHASAGFGRTDNTKRKKSCGVDGRDFFPGIMLSISSRRKGAPHRSPLS
ncbi:hypothetical protein HPP92_009501 [Vanilla planifolia]|uniref:B box-type domain-containing protein n=1 Tax=Vanilla planifolia TaxID=51239 RepID=A0A835V4S9_VANPL|nr:hypothetical protein HPP92_009501 [Vanilla planifolia]